MIRKNIPNAITCGNLFCGCLALVQAFEGNLLVATCFVGVALILDFFDGFTARMLKVSSAIGKDLDSLADMVTFGVVPGVIMFKMLSAARLVELAHASGAPDASALATDTSVYLPQYFAFIITIFSCIRLAKFNNDTRQSDSFIGLPTPANTMVICSFPLIMTYQTEMTLFISFLGNTAFLIGVCCVMSYLLVAEIPLFALKFKNFNWKDNKLPFSFLAVSVVLIAVLHFAAIPVVIALYILLSLASNRVSRSKAK